MTIGADLFRSMTPPGVWITLHELDHVESDERQVTLRLKETRRRSISVHVMVSRYSPEASILRALVDTVERLTAAQRRLDKATVESVFRRSIQEYVEPF